MSVQETNNIAGATSYTSESKAEPVEVNLRTLLEAGVHFGHQTSRWNPAMSPYIYGSRNGIHIINLPKTVQYWKAARKKIVDIASSGGNILFVGTKKQAQEVVIEQATRCGAFYVANNWLGGMITNFQTIRKSIERMNKLEVTLQDEDASIKAGGHSRYTKKERLMMSRELEKLTLNLGGIRNMPGAPDLVFIIDIKREDISVKEVRRLDIPVVALVDTNCDPSLVDYIIPSNDDGSRAIKLFTTAVADAVIEGSFVYEQRRARGEFKSVEKQSVPTASKSRPKHAPAAVEAAKEATIESEINDALEQSQTEAVN